MISFQKLEVKWSIDKIENTHLVQNQKEEASRSIKNESGKRENSNEGLL